MSDSYQQPKKIDPTREAVAGDALSWGGQRPLPWAFDDLTRELGDDVYQRMLRDAQVAANLNLYTAAVLEDGVSLTSAVTDKTADGYDAAAELVAEVERQLDDMELALDDSLWDILRTGLACGSKVAEEVYAIDAAPSGARQYVLRALKPKPRAATAYVVDAFLNVVGLRGRTVEAGGYELLPRAKFAIFTFRPQDGDPRGTSLLRTAYNGYDLKLRTWVPYYKYLIQFASPSIVATTAQGAPDEPDPDDPETVITAVEALLTRLLEFQNGTALALPYGSTAQLLASTGDGKAFLEAFALYDRQITTGILGQTRATMEAAHGSKADSETASDILATFIRQTRKALARMLRRDVLADLVEYNHGPAFRRLAPRVSFGETEQVDVAPLMAGVAALKRVDYLDPSQLPDLDIQLGLSARTPEELARRQERAANPPAPVVVQPGSSPQDDQQDPNDPNADPEQQDQQQ
jgi:hypothetical protein